MKKVGKVVKWVLLALGVLFLLLLSPYLLMFVLFLRLCGVDLGSSSKPKESEKKEEAGAKKWSFFDWNPLESPIPPWDRAEVRRIAEEMERKQKAVRYLSPDDKEVSADNKTLSDPSIVQYYPGSSPVRFESSQKEEQE